MRSTYDCVTTVTPNLAVPNPKKKIVPKVLVVARIERGFYEELGHSWEAMVFSSSAGFRSGRGRTGGRRRIEATSARRFSSTAGGRGRRGLLIMLRRSTSGSPTTIGSDREMAPRSVNCRRGWGLP